MIDKDFMYKVLDNETVAITQYIGSDTEIVIPSEIDGKKVTSIGESAFWGCKKLTSVTIPNSVTSIGDSAFYKCTNLTNITMPNSVTSIGELAFYRCVKLESVTIPKSVIHIGDCAFECPMTIER